MVFRASDLVITAVKKRSPRAYAVATCECCETVQTCKSCTKTSPPSTCRPPTTFCGGTLVVSRSTFNMLKTQLESVMSEFYAASGVSPKSPRRKASKRGARKKK